MSTRPRLITSIPFWILLVASAALTAIGAWLVLSRLALIETAITAQTPEAQIAGLLAQSAVTPAAAVLGAGIIGLILSLAVAALSTLRPQTEVVIEEIDWDSDDESVLAVDADASSPAAPAVAGDPVVVSEAPDIETPSDAPAPDRARD